jgi:nicotinamide riboside kinase
MVRHQQSSHRGLCHSDPHAIAGDTRLSNLEERRSNAIAIADANFIIRQTGYCKVLAKLPK